MPHCNSDNFQIFLDELSASRPGELKIIVLDNGAFHKAKRLQIPQDIVLYFLPPYSPELNPAEKIWAKFKRDFTNKYFETLDALSDFLEVTCRNLTQDQVKSISRFKYIFEGSFWTIE